MSPRNFPTRSSRHRCFSPLRSISCSKLARLIAWVIVIVIPLQGFAAAIERVWMPEHLHAVVQVSHARATTRPYQHQHTAGVPRLETDHKSLHQGSLSHHHDHDESVVLIDVPDDDSRPGAAKSLLDGFDLNSRKLLIFPLAIAAKCAVDRADRYSSIAGDMPERPPR